MEKTKGPKFDTNRLFAWLSVLILVVLILAFIFKGPLVNNTKKTSTSSTNAPTKVGDISKWKTFKSSLFNYSIKYPTEWPTYTKLIDLGASQQLEAFFINRSENQAATQVYQPHIEIYGNFQGDWCNNNACKIEDVTVSGVSGKKFMYIKDLVGDEIYYFESKKITIFVSKQKEATTADQVIKSLSFN